MLWISLAILIAVPVLALLGFRLVQTSPRQLGVGPDGRFADLGPRHNWVSSDATDPVHRVDPLSARDDSTFELLVVMAESLPRTRVVTREENYVHLECRSLIFRFVDDLELYRRPDHWAVSVRSASRAGARDFGVNRMRVERIRYSLAP
jgi:uncharacterized protein (DUF1499 family)